MSLGKFDFSRAVSEALHPDGPPTKADILESLERLCGDVNANATPQEIAQIMIIVFCDLLLIPGVIAPAGDEDINWRGAFFDGYAAISRWAIKSLLVALKRQSDFNTRVITFRELDRILPKIDPDKVRVLFDIESGDAPSVIAKRIMGSLTRYFHRLDRFAHAGAVLFADMTLGTFNGDAVPLAIVSQLDAEFADIRSYRPLRYGSVDFNVLGRSGNIRVFGPSSDATIVTKTGDQTEKVVLATAQTPEKTSVHPASLRTPSVPEADKALMVRVKALEDQLSDARKEITEAKRQSAQADQDRLVKLLKGRIRVLQNALSRTDQGPPKEIEYPKSFDELGRFAAEHLGDRVIISRRAQRAATSSNFRNVQFAYRVLKMLADDYRPMRDGEEGAKERFDATCQLLKVSVAPTGMALLAHRTSETYRLNHMGKRYPLDLHVQGSSSFDPRDGFRLYFHVIEAEEEGRSIVVGHFPEHLTNSMT